jgi:hypothetical protein
MVESCAEVVGDLLLGVAVLEVRARDADGSPKHSFG